MAFKITTTGTKQNIPLADLAGRTFSHPVVNYDIEVEFSIEDNLPNNLDLENMKMTTIINGGSPETVTLPIPYGTKALSEIGTYQIIIEAMDKAANKVTADPIVIEIAGPLQITPSEVTIASG